MTEPMKPDPNPTAGAAEIEALRSRVELLEAALRIIAGEEQCLDNLLGNSDVARIALHGR